MKKFWIAVIFFLVANGQIFAKENISLKNIVVTAQKQDENFKDIPISLSIFNEFQIEDKGFENYNDLTNHSSNFTIFDAGGTGMMATYIRGVASDTGAESANVGVYVDGIPYVNTFGNDIPIENIQRIEVLKGPQSVLYGKNSYAGVVNIISKPPSGIFEGNTKVTLGSDGKRKVSLTLNAPAVADKLYLSLFARHNEKDGFVRNTTLNIEDNFKEDRYGKFHLLFTPSDRLDLSLISSVLDKNDGAPAWNQTDAPDRLVVASDFQGVNRTDSVTHALKADYRFGSHQLSSVTTVKDLDNLTTFDADFTPFELFHTEADMAVKEYSQEIRLTGDIGRVNYLAGVYADIMTKDRFLTINRLPFQDYETESRTLSIFAHGTLDLSKKMTLSGGARLDRDKITLDDDFMGFDDENSYTNLAPKVSLTYAFSDDTTVYATVSKGYKSGGYFLFAPTPDRRWVEKEEMTNYEIGAKSYLTDNFTISASAFFMEIKDKQVTTHVAPLISYVDNAAQCDTMGFEVDADLRLTREISLYASFGLADSEFKEFRDGIGDYTGNKNPFSPLYTYSLGGTYRGARGLFATAGLRGQDKMYTDKENITVTDAYYLIDAKIGYESERFDVYLYAENLLDKVYDTRLGVGSSYLSSPREIGFQARFRF